MVLYSLGRLNEGDPKALKLQLKFLEGRAESGSHVSQSSYGSL